MTPEGLSEAIRALRAATLPPELVPTVRLAVASLRTLLDIYALLSMLRVSVAELRRRLGVTPPGKSSDSKKDGADVPPPSGSETSQQGGTSEAGPPKEPQNAAPGGTKPNGAKPKGSKGEGPKLRKDGQPYGRDEHGRRGKEDIDGAGQRYFAHPDFDHSGCRCPECAKQKVYLMGAVGGGIRFSGQPHLKATSINREIWRCGDCGAHFPAPLPAEITADGGHGRVGYSAAATIACAKYLYGTPWARQESQGSLLDLDIPATTQWEQVKGLVSAALPVYRYLFHAAAPAYLFFTDDTTARIIGVTEMEKIQRKSGKLTNRTGVHTSCVVSVLPGGRYIVIYKTAIIHAGELLDEVLRNRPKGLLVPYHMSDGLSANPPTVCAVIEGECNAHARRKLEEKKDQWPAAWKYVEGIYKTVYKNDAKAAELGMTPEERLGLHRRESLPLMREMFRWMQDCFDKKEVEPNSKLGGIFEYFLTREYGLTMFCRHAGFPLDNNLCEAAQKLVGQHRKNAEYFRTLRGAEAADVIMSLGATAKRSGANAHHYFVMLQRHKDEVKASPERFLPWNYQETVAALAKRSPPPPRVLEVSEAEFKDRQQRLRSTNAWGRPKSRRAVSLLPAAKA